jgi:hypothetical protein
MWVGVGVGVAFGAGVGVGVAFGAGVGVGVAAKLTEAIENAAVRQNNFRYKCSLILGKILGMGILLKAWRC